MNKFYNAAATLTFRDQSLFGLLCLVFFISSTWYFSEIQLKKAF